jgi:hypothetical protein
MGMPDPLVEALFITLTVPFAYLFTITFPVTTAFALASILVKN